MRTAIPANLMTLDQVKNFVDVSKLTITKAELFLRRFYDWVAQHAHDGCIKDLNVELPGYTNNQTKKYLRLMEHAGLIIGDGLVWNWFKWHKRALQSRYSRRQHIYVKIKESNSKIERLTSECLHSNLLNASIQIGKNVSINKGLSIKNKEYRDSSSVNTNTKDLKTLKSIRGEESERRGEHTKSLLAETLFPLPIPTEKKPAVESKKLSWFEKIWRLYPDPKGKKQALRHFLSSVNTESDFEAIHKALQNYIGSSRVRSGYVQNGSTWFNNWRDWINHAEREIQPGKRIVGFAAPKPGKYDHLVEGPYGRKKSHG